MTFNDFKQKISDDRIRSEQRTRLAEKQNGRDEECPTTALLSFIDWLRVVESAKFLDFDKGLKQFADKLRRNGSF